MNASELSQLNRGDMPIIETHFYKWLSEHGNVNGHRLNNKKAYYEFMQVERPLTEELIANLNAIHSHFYYSTEGWR